jgi:recombinational DNA repair ATPase RecF
VEEVVVVMDNLNTPRLSSGHETFTAEEAFAIAQKLEIHYTPKYGSWLNLAAIELSAMTSQCLDRRIDTLEKLKSELKAWHQERNGNQKTVKWPFTTKDARIKLHGLYPSI